MIFARAGLGNMAGIIKTVMKSLPIESSIAVFHP